MNDTTFAQRGARKLAASQLHLNRNRLELIWADKLDDVTPPDWLIKGIQVSDSLAMTYGPAGGGKTFNTLDKALHIASGRDFHGRKVQQGVVLYVAGEGRIGIAKRLRAWCQHHGVDRKNLPFALSARAVRLIDPDDVAVLLESISEAQFTPILVVIDTLARNFGGGDENSTRDMNQFVDALDEIRIATGACVEVVHHTGKDESGLARGSSVLRAAVDTEIAIKPRDGGFRFSCTKQKDAEPFEPIVFSFEKVGLGVIDGEHIESLVPILDTCPEVSTSGSRLGDCQRAGIELLRRFYRRAMDRGVDGGSFVIEKKEVRDCLQDESRSPDGKAYGQSAAYDFPAFAIKEGYAREINKKLITVIEGEWLE